MDQNAIKALRERLDLDREQFAALFPVDPATVWRWEEGKSTPTPIVRKRLAELAGDQAPATDAPDSSTEAAQ